MPKYTRLRELNGPEHTFIQNEDEINEILDMIGAPCLSRPPYLVVIIGDGEYTSVYGVNSPNLEALAWEYALPA